MDKDEIARKVDLLASRLNEAAHLRKIVADQTCKQFWNARAYEGNPTEDSSAIPVKLLDNSLDEVSNGATYYVNIDILENKKDMSRMLLIEDGGGMNLDKMRQRMSLGYSIKSKQANTIEKYGNSFKASTMRLEADVIVFSYCLGKGGKSPTQSIELLSSTFLRSTYIRKIL